MHISQAAALLCMPRSGSPCLNMAAAAQMPRHLPRYTSFPGCTALWFLDLQAHWRLLRLRRLRRLHRLLRPLLAYSRWQWRHSRRRFLVSLGWVSHRHTTQLSGCLDHLQCHRSHCLVLTPRRFLAGMHPPWHTRLAPSALSRGKIAHLLTTMLSWLILCQTCTLHRPRHHGPPLGTRGFGYIASGLVRTVTHCLLRPHRCMGLPHS